MTSEENKPLGYKLGDDGPQPIPAERLDQIRRFVKPSMEGDGPWNIVVCQLLEHVDHLQAQLDAANEASIDFFGDDDD